MYVQLPVARITKKPALEMKAGLILDLSVGFLVARSRGHRLASGAGTRATLMTRSTVDHGVRTFQVLDVLQQSTVDRRHHRGHVTSDLFCRLVLSVVFANDVTMRVETPIVAIRCWLYLMQLPKCPSSESL